MMIITNGTVSRTFKPADYEARTVSLSFSMDPGEDYEACVALALAMAERQARGVNSPTVGDKSTGKPRRPPAAVVDPTDPVVSAAEPAGNASAVSGEPATVLDDEPNKDLVELVAEVFITDDELMKACQATTHRLHDPKPTKDTVRGFVEKAGMSVVTIPQKDRKAFLAALAALKSEEK